MKPAGLACLFLHFMLLHFCSNNTLETDEESEFHSDPQLPPLNLGHQSCGFKADGGACKASIERFYFNIFTRQCEVFEYGGCGGNDNNFETLLECKTKCIVNDTPKKRRGKFKYQKPEFCLLEEDPGICRGLISRYFYSKDSGKCEIFKYGGCFGNANNFRALEDCQITCQDHLTPSSDGQTQTPETLNESLPFQMPTASPRTGRFRGPSLCQNQVDKGNCSATVKRFYYNHDTRKCMPFLYTGCGGNENNFTSRKSCLKVCKKDSVKSRRKKKKQSFKQSSDPLTSALA